MEPSQEEIERYQKTEGGYYRNPEPAEAAYELLFTLRYTAYWQQPELTSHLTYQFCRIAQLTPAVIPLYEALLHALPEEQQKIVQRILAISRGLLSSQGAMPSPLDQAPDSTSYLDWCWVEFLVTGDLAAVRHIAKVLDGKDHLREQLEAWYATHALPTPGLFSKIFSSRPTQTLQTLGQIGIEFDPQTSQIKGDEDIDYHCFRLAENKIKVFPMLPVQPTAASMLSLALKGSAVWSLRSNAQQHERVAVCCRGECQKPGGTARRWLDLARQTINS